MFEPFRIKSIEAIKFNTKEERRRIIKDAGYNLFQVNAEDVIIDLLTDSGTSAMSKHQWSSLMLGDESYAGGSSFRKFEGAVRNITNHSHVIPTHQGRAAERILFSILGGEGKYFISNSFFDTTRGNIELSGSVAIDIPKVSGELGDGTEHFKGDMDIAALKKLIALHGKENIPLVVMTITNNKLGGQPVSMGNIEQVATICRENCIELFFDSCRFAENAYFIKYREKGFAHRSIFEICKEMFSYSDGSTMSAKKDGLTNTGGWLSLNDTKLADKCKSLLIVTEGFPTYGGLSGREMEAIAQGLDEVLDEKYLHYRVKSVEYLGELLKKSKVPIVEPTGGHGVYIDAKRFAPHIPPHQFPGQSIACQLYVQGGIRSCEIGSVMFDRNSSQGHIAGESLELVRLAIPRRVYTKSHLDYTAKIIAEVYESRKQLRGMEFVYTPEILRHFTATFREIYEDNLHMHISDRRDSKVLVENIKILMHQTQLDA